MEKNLVTGIKRDTRAPCLNGIEENGADELLVEFAACSSLVSAPAASRAQRERDRHSPDYPESKNTTMMTRSLETRFQQAAITHWQLCILQQRCKQ